MAEEEFVEVIDPRLTAPAIPGEIGEPAEAVSELLPPPAADADANNDDGDDKSSSASPPSEGGAAERMRDAEEALAFQGQQQL